MPELVEGKPLGLASFPDKLDDIGREVGQRKRPCNVGSVDVHPVGYLADGRYLPGDDSLHALLRLDEGTLNLASESRFFLYVNERYDLPVVMLFHLARDAHDKVASVVFHLVFVGLEEIFKNNPKALEVLRSGKNFFDFR